VTGSAKQFLGKVKSLTVSAAQARVLHQVQPDSFGVRTDAVSFSEGGHKTATLFSLKVSQQVVAFYNQELHGLAKLALGPFLNFLKLSLT
jgi:hypothetical protein